MFQLVGMDGKGFVKAQRRRARGAVSNAAGRYDLAREVDFDALDSLQGGVQMLLVVRHAVLDPEAAPSGFLVEQRAAEAAAEGAALNGNGKRPREEDEDEPRGEEAEDLDESDGFEMLD